MQNSSAFQYIAIDQIVPSLTNPRKTFAPDKLAELAVSIRQHGVIQPVVVRPKDGRFELVAGERRFLASQIAEQFSIPAHIKELTDAQAIEWQLIENSQRVDVHPYEEAQGFQRLLEMPGYDVAAIVAKTGKSDSHIYARLTLMKLIPDVAQAFVEERITASHANLIARLPEEHQAEAFENCWRKDWQDDAPHLLPAKHLSAWIENNLFLDLADAPFDREDLNLNPEAGPCSACPKRSGYNTTLFCDVQGDQCLDGACYQTKVAAHIEGVLADRPGLVQIETAYRAEHGVGALTKNAYRLLDIPDNPDSDLPCASTRTAIVVYGRSVGTTVMVCLDNHCPVHDPATAARIAKEQAEHPAPVATPPVENETTDERQAREAENERQRQEYAAEEERRRAERQAEFDRQQKEYEVETRKREKAHKLRLATLERIVEHAPAILSSDQLRLVLQMLLNDGDYGSFEAAAEHFTPDDENHGQTEDEILIGALSLCADEKLTGFLLRLVFAEHTAFPLGEQVDWLEKAAMSFAPEPAKAAKNAAKKGSAATVTARTKKPASERQAA